LASHPPAVPSISDRLSSAFHPGCARGSTASFPRSCIRRSTFRSASGSRRILPPPASPSDQLPTLRRPSESSGCTFRLTASLRRPSTFQSCFRTRSPACASDRTPQLYLRPRAPTFIGTRVLRLCLPTQPPTLHRVSRPLTSPFSQPADFHRPSTFRLSPPFDLRLSPASHLWAFPSHPAPDLRRSLHPPVLSATDLRSQMEFESSDRAVDLLPTCVDS
jgi:hypothetical protein